jgi:hypothetical protein
MSVDRATPPAEPSRTPTAPRATGRSTTSNRKSSSCAVRSSAHDAGPGPGDSTSLVIDRDGLAQEIGLNRLADARGEVANLAPEEDE